MNLQRIAFDFKVLRNKSKTRYATYPRAEPRAQDQNPHDDSMERFVILPKKPKRIAPGLRGSVEEFSQLLPVDTLSSGKGTRQSSKQTGAIPQVLYSVLQWER